MTINQLMAILTEQHQVLGGEALVAFRWDSNLSKCKNYGIYNGALVLDVPDWGDADLEFDDMAFDADRAVP